MRQHLSRITFWRAVAALILAAGAYATYVRITAGLGASTNLSDRFPWGLWIGFDVLCGVGLAAGGFTIAAIVHVFNIRQYEPVLRPTILTAFLGYGLVIVGLLFDLGRPLQIWHAIIMWNPRSVMFEVAWCVMLYTTVLALEFAPVVLEKFRMARAIRVLRAISIPVVILGVLLSTLHQSSLGSLFLIVPGKLDALWYSPYLPVFFWVSAIAVGCAMVIFESFLSARAFKRGLELHLLAGIGRIAAVALAVYLTMKVMDAYSRGILGLLFIPRFEAYLCWFELGIGVLIPMVLLAFARVRLSQTGLFMSATMIILGFILNRMNITITGMEGSAGMSYLPSWMEAVITLSIVTAGFIAFAVTARYFPVFERASETRHETPVTTPDPWTEDVILVSQSQTS
jgi:Ni/Fe-hydrogenase subunit HybB-like protein